MTKIWTFYYGINSDRTIAADTFEQALEKAKAYLEREVKDIGLNRRIIGLVLKKSADIE